MEIRKQVLTMVSWILICCQTNVPFARMEKKRSGLELRRSMWTWFGTHIESEKMLNRPLPLWACRSEEWSLLGIEIYESSEDSEKAQLLKSSCCPCKSPEFWSTMTTCNFRGSSVLLSSLGTHMDMPIISTCARARLKLYKPKEVYELSVDYNWDLKGR